MKPAFPLLLAALAATPVFAESPGTPAAASAGAALPDFSAIVASQGRAVVNLHVLRALPDSADDGDGDNKTPGLPRYKASVGSGFIISPDGLILTNRHVVDGADKITVKFINKLELPARVVGVDAATDVAVLKVEARNLPVATLGDSDQLLVGQWVLAIGAPFGLERSASQGIISTLNRALPGDAYVPFIQTDVPINPGNSGGPLFDTQGRVVGINSQIFSKSGGYMGLSFAIPINTAMAMARQIIETGQARHGWAGIATQELSQDLARAFGLPLPQGALVTEVTPGSPGAKAGLEPGDIILALDDKPLVNSADMPPLVGVTLPGQTRVLTVLRGGQLGRLNLVVGDLQDGALAGKGKAAGERVARLNLSVAPTDEATRKVLGITTGLLVRELGPGPAAEAGILPGDILLQLGRQRLDTVEQLAQAGEALPVGQPVPVMIRRRDGILFLPVTLLAPQK
ncbi:MAG: trypsin-like peptidase domain-containing protein [Pseudomonadota bacterium]